MIPTVETIFRMKNTIAFIFIVSVLFSSCNNNKKTNTEITSDIINNPVTANGKSSKKDLPIIHFQKKVHDFGIIIQGEKVSHRFKFKNIGKSDLVIKNASASCGCTVPSFSQKPILPGEEGEIEVVFNSANRSGHQTKTITVWSNTQPNQNRLSIECEIVVRK